MSASNQPTLVRIEWTAQQFHDLCNEWKRLEIWRSLEDVTLDVAVATLAFSLSNALAILCKEEMAAGVTIDNLVPFLKDQVSQMLRDPTYIKENAN